MCVCTVCDFVICVIFCLQHDTDPDGNVVVKVTLDDVVEVMAGAKALQQLNVDIPDAAMQILKQVWKINAFVCSYNIFTNNQILHFSY